MGLREHIYLHLSTLAIVLAASLVIWAISWKAFLMIQLPIIYFASVLGVWLFYVQHQYENVKWVRSNKWDYKTIALEGSSFYKLLRIFQWFTGNIGYHHVHHLGPRIPNYNLQKCHEENQIFQDVKPITFFSSLKSLRLRLWDEEQGKIIGFSELKNRS